MAFELKKGWDLKVDINELEQWREDVIDGNIYGHTVPVEIDADSNGTVEKPVFQTIVEGLSGGV